MPAATVLFDFDGTLVRGDCAAAWLRGQLRSHPLRRLAAGLSFPFLAPGFAWWRSAWLPASFYTWLATVGRTQEALVEAREDFLRDCALRRDELLITPAVRRLHAHLEAGDAVVIVTGAEASLARDLWRVLGQPEVPVVGSFDQGIGTFFADDVLDGRAIRVRFRWADTDTGSPLWEQAFSVDDGASWETNWRMHFTRAA